MKTSKLLACLMTVIGLCTSVAAYSLTTTGEPPTLPEDGKYYIIVSQNTVYPSEVVEYRSIYIDPANSRLPNHPYDPNSQTMQDVFLVKKTGDGLYTMQHVATGKYAGNATDNNNKSDTPVSLYVRQGELTIKGTALQGFYISTSDPSDPNNVVWNTYGGTFNWIDKNKSAGWRSLYRFEEPSASITNKMYAADGIDSLTRCHARILSIYNDMSDPTYKDAALTAERRTALENKLGEVATAIETSPSADNSYYYNLADELQTLYNKCPWVDGGNKYWPLTIDSIADGKRIMIESAHPSYRNKFIVAYPDKNDMNSVMINDLGKSEKNIWQLVATGTTDAIYTDKPTYYLKDLTSGKYLGATDPNSINHGDKRMVDGTDKAYAFAFLTKDEIKEKENNNLDLYGCNDAVFIHHSNADGTWFRLSRFQNATELYYISSSAYPNNNDWQTMNIYSGDKDFNIADELTSVLAETSDIIDNIGPDPGKLPEASMTAYLNAQATAKAITSSNTRQEYRTAIDNLRATYEAAKATPVNPVTDGYYYIESAWTSKAGQHVVAYDPNDGSNMLKNHANTNSAYDIFQLITIGDGQYALKNIGSGLYVGQAVDANYITLVESMTEGVYQTFTYDTKGEFKWKDNKTSFTYYINGDWIGRYNKQATSGFDAWYLRTVPQSTINKIHAADGIDSLTRCHARILSIYNDMSDPTYKDAALTAERRTALENKLGEVATAIETSPSADNSYYYNLADELQTLYNKCPWVDGGNKYWPLTIDSIADGKRIMIESAHPSYRNKFIVAYPDKNDMNSVMINDLGKSEKNIWQLVATGTTDAIYTDKPTYYLKDLTSGKYLGATDPNSINHGDKRMVDGTDKAYAFAFLTKDEIKEKENNNLDLYGCNDAVFIHHSNADGTWFRLSRFQNATELYYISSSAYPNNNDWQTMNIYSGDKDFNIADELTSVLAETSDIIDNIGPDPGKLPEASMTAYLNAQATAKAITSSNTRQEYRTAIDNLRATYEAAKATPVNPVTDGYYYIESAWTSKAGQHVVAYDPNDGSNMLKNHANTNSAYDIFQLITIGDGQYALKNIGSGLYVGQAVDANYITLVESMTEGVYQTFTYDTKGEFKWKDNKTSCTYYIFGDWIGRYYRQTTSGFDAWYLRTVPQSTIDKLLYGISFAVEGNSLVAQGTNIGISSISNALAENTGVADIDLTNATLSEEVTAAELSALLNGNQLAYLPESSALEGRNIIKGGNCAELILTDNADFKPQSVFTAAQASYTKSGLDGSGWYSAVLPYDFTVPDGVKVLNNAIMSEDFITFDNVEAGAAIAANTPFLYKTTADAITFETTNATVTAAPAASGELQGTFVKIPAGDATGKIILNKYGTSFATATAKAAIPAFRAYLNARAGSKSFSIVINNELTGIASADAVNGKAEPVDVCTVDGKLIRKQVNAMTALQGLPKGIYIVNGKKIRK